MKIKIHLLILLSLCLWVLPSVAFAEGNYNVVTILSKGIPQYNKALDGFKNGIDGSIHVVYEDFGLDNFSGKEEELTNKVVNLNPNLIFTVGTEAAVFAKNNFKDIPIIFSMVLNPVESGIVKSMEASGENIAGISLKISIEIQFKKIKEVLPTTRKIGMLYDANQMTALKDEAAAAAKKLGLELIAIPVNSKADIDKSLTLVLKQSDFLWAGVDSLIYNSQSSQHILLTTLRNKIPFMAFSSNYVNAGALMALECDYFDIGKQSAELSLKVLQGAAVGSFAVFSPREQKLVVNEKTAETIGVELPNISLK